MDGAGVRESGVPKQTPAATIPHVGDLFNLKNPSTTSLIGHQSLKVVINNDVPPILDEPIKSDVGDISRMPASCKEHVGD